LQHDENLRKLKNRTIVTLKGPKLQLNLYVTKQVIQRIIVHMYSDNRR